MTLIDRHKKAAEILPVVSSVIGGERYTVGSVGTFDHIVDLCCEAWNKLIDQPWRIMTIGHRKWASEL